MKETIHLLVMFALLLALIIGGVKFLKNRHSFTLAATDASMTQAEFPPGSYRVDVRVPEANYKAGDVIAYRQPGESSVELIGRIVALEGQTVACDKATGGLIVNGKATTFPGDMSRRIAEFRVPRGCLYVLCDNPMNGFDSVNFGPIPIQYVKGRIVR